ASDANSGRVLSNELWVLSQGSELMTHNSLLKTVPELAISSKSQQLLLCSHRWTQRRFCRPACSAQNVAAPCRRTGAAKSGNCCLWGRTGQLCWVKHWIRYTKSCRPEALLWHKAAKPDRQATATHRLCRSSDRDGRDIPADDPNNKWCHWQRS